MPRRRFAATGAALALTLAVAGTALAVVAIPGVLDQSHVCADTACNTSNAALYPVGYGDLPVEQRVKVSIGQTFTAGKTGKLTAVSLYLGSAEGKTPPTLTVALAATDAKGLPNVDAILAFGTVPTTDFDSSVIPSWVTLVFATPASVVAGHTYAILLGGIEPDNAWVRWAIDVMDPNPYPDYPGGEAVTGFQPVSELDAEAPWTWQALGPVLADTTGVKADFAFRTYVEAASTPTQPPTDTAAAPSGGSGASGLLALGALLAAISLAALAVPATARRRRAS